MDDREFVDRLVAWDVDAWEQFVHRFRNRMFGILVIGFRFRDHDAADVFQAVVVKFLQHDGAALRTWTGEGSLMAYVSTVTRRAAIDKLRELSRHPVSQDLVTIKTETLQPSPFEILVFNERRDLMRTISATMLNERELRIFRRWLEGWSYRTLASEEQMTTSGLGVMLNRIRTRVCSAVRSHLQRPDLRQHDTRRMAHVVRHAA